MQFKIGPWLYSVFVADGALYDEEGGECAGLCDWSENAIYISGAIPLERRSDVLLHELHHAWVYHFGEPEGAENRANSASSFTMMCINEFVAQGGDKAMMAMTPAGLAMESPGIPTESGSTATWAQSSPDGGTECGWCGRRFSAGEIVTGEPVAHPQTGKLAIPRSIYCEGCDHVLEWHEGTMFDHTPSGQIVGKLRRMRGKEAGAWLRLHGDQAGVVMA